MNGSSEDTPSPSSDNREDITGPIRVLPASVDPRNEVLWHPTQATDSTESSQGTRALYKP